MGDATSWREASSRTAYRGPDRRAPVTAHPSSARVASLVAATVTVVAGSSGIVVDRALGEPRDAEVLATATVAASVAAAVLAVLVTVTAWAHGRATGTAFPFRLAVGAALLAVAFVGDLVVGGSFVGQLVVGDRAGGAGDADGALTGVRSAAVVLAAGWLIAGLRGPAVEARRHITRQVVVTVGVVASAGVAGWPLGVASGVTSDGPVPVVGALAGLLGGAAWLAVAGRCAVDRHRDGDALTRWVLWSAVAVGIAELVVAVPGGPTGVVAPALRTAGLFTAALGVAAAMATHVAGRRTELLRARATARETARRERQRESVRDHELGNALFAVEGAALTLARHGEELATDTRQELAGSIARGIGHVQALTRDQEPVAEDVVLGEVVRDRLRLAEGRGTATQLTGELATRARADRTVVAQVVDNLVLNAVRHGGAGPDAPVRLHVGPEGGWAVIRVSDDGPGIPDHTHDLVFGEGFRLGARAEGAGLGLAVSRKLLRDFGGDLVIAPGRRRGCSLVASLPLGLGGDRRLADG